MADDPMLGSVMKVAIFTSVFLVVFALLYGGAAQISNNNTIDSNINSKTFTSSEYAAMTWWTYSNASGFPTNFSSMGGVGDFSPDDFGTWFSMPSELDVALVNTIGGDLSIGGGSYTDADHVIRWHSGSYTGLHDVRIIPLNDSFWVFHAGGGWDRWSYQITNAEILGAVKTDANDMQSAAIHCKVGPGITIVFSFDAGYSPEYALLYHTGFHLAVGQMPIDTSYNPGDVWSIVGQLLTFSLRSTGVWWVDYIASTLIWAGLLIVGFYLINRLLDHVPFT